MTRKYYSARRKPKGLTLAELYVKLQSLFAYFREKDYFKGKAGVHGSTIPNEIRHKARMALDFELFHIGKWPADEVTEDRIFDALEFLFDHVSKPGVWAEMTTESGWNYSDYDGYNDKAGQLEFRETVNAFLGEYKNGYELTEGGTILASVSAGLEQIIDAEIVPYDEINVDNKVRSAIVKWRNRHVDIAEKREAIRELADVFEWLKKTRRLKLVLDKVDESAIFSIANNFGIRHHNPDQKTGFDRAIWYS